MLLDEIQPTYQFYQKRVEDVEASPDVVYKNIWNYPINGSLPFKVLIGMRNLPSRLVGKGSYLPVGELTVSRWLNETHFVLLAEKENEEIVFGLIGQFWKPLYGRVLRIPEVEKFIEFDEPGFVKTAANFFIESKDNGVRLSIEVHVYATDEAALRGFGFYWRLIELFGGLLRTDMIRRIKSKAEKEMRTL